MYIFRKFCSVMIIALSICLINYIKDYILIHNLSINFITWIIKCIDNCLLKVIIFIISCVSSETICLYEAFQFKVILIYSEDNEEHNYNWNDLLY